MIERSEHIISEFSRQVRQKLKNKIIKVMLFGSRARGDNNDYSDYDFLIIVDKRDNNVKEKLLKICVDMLNNYDSLISFILWDEREWIRKKKFPIGLNITKEGKEI